MADFTKRFRRTPQGPGTAQGGVATTERGGQAASALEQQPPPPDPRSRVAPAQTAAPTDETQELDRTAADEPHYGGAAARTGDHVRGDHDHDGVRERDENRRAAATTTGATAVRERDAEADRDAPATRRRVTAVREEYGGFNWGSAFFGWLVAIGLGALLTAAVTGAGTAVGLTEEEATSNAETIGIGGGILLLIVAMIAWYSGGYVAGRMSRFDGARQGFGVWVFGLIATVAIAAAGWILGDEYNLLERLDLPRIPIDAGDLTTGGLIALAAILLGTLVAAVAGAKFGQRYHNKIDRHGFGEPLR